MKEKDSDDEEEIEDEEEIRYEVILIGESGVGKKSIMKSILKDNFKENMEPTISIAYAEKNIKLEKYKGKILQFGIWDTPGQEKYRSLTKNFFPKATAALLVYDTTKKNSFEEIKNFWYNQVIEYCPEDKNNFYFFF